MKIMLNDLELPRQAEGVQTVGQVLAELREEIRRNEKVITRVALDGQVLPDGQTRPRELMLPVDRVKVLSLVVEEPAALRQRTVRDAVELTQRLVRQSKSLGRKFRLGDEVTANQELAAFVEDLKLVLAGLDHSTRSTLPAATNPETRARLIEAANRLLPSLDRLYRAQAAGDCIAIADELEYDIYEELATWPGLFGEVERALESLPQPQ